MSNLFNQLEIEAFRAGVTPRTAQSREWFRKRIANLRGKEMRRIDRNEILRNEPVMLRDREAIGSMYCFWYDPKHKKTLPYYDAFPLVIPLGPAKGGFLGMNLHYLPPTLRAKMLDALMDNLSNKRFDQSTRFNVNYNLLQRAARLKYYKPTIKHYLTAHVRSRFGYIPPTEWEISVFLPLADWQKSTGNQVYADSRRMING